MKPGQIRVFDGLRITTEHVSHLQMALHSGVQDLREVLGLGKVHRGLAVAAEGTGGVRVEPGIAFDYERNRIICDEPSSVPVSFAPGEQSKYICVKYQQVEDGVVEDQPTLIFDSCAVEVRGAPPEAGENVVAIAKVTRSETGELQVSPVEEETEPAPPVSAAAIKLRIAQGVLRFAPETGTENWLAGVLAPALRDKIGPDAELVFPAAEQEIPLDFTPAGLTVHAIGSAAVSVAARESAEYRAEARAHGEVSGAAERLAQFGITSIAGRHEFHDGALMRVPLDPQGESGFLDSLALEARAAATNGGIKAVCTLVWRGAVTEEIIGILETRKPALAWSALLAWKALGEGA
jgi:hypothetical protein